MPTPPELTLPLDAMAIQAIIPHRYPFLLIDQVVELEPGKRAVALKQVSINEFFFQGHYPAYPVMPGVLILEAIAQTGAVLALSDPANVGKVPIFGGVDHCRFRQQVRPGDTLRLEMEITAIRGPVGKGHGRAWVGDRLACEADLTFVFGPPLAAPATRGAAPHAG